MKRAATALLFLVSFCASAQRSTQLLIHYDTDSFNVRVADSVRIASVRQADSLMIVHIEISGYCDEKGRPSYNDSLSQKRALAAGAIVKSLFPQATVQAKGQGSIPLDDRSGLSEDQQRATNRKTEITFMYAPAEKPKKVIEVLMSDTLKAGDKFTLQNILFVGGLSVLLPESNEALKDLVTTLKYKSKLKIRILGHVCCTAEGRDAVDYNTGQKNLSVARAKAIYDYLIYHGIDKKRLDYQGMKGRFPTGRGDKFDRRVEIEITDTQ